MLILIILKVDIIQKIKNNLLLKSIQDNRSYRNIQLHTFPQAQHIGVLIEICQEEDYKNLIYLTQQQKFDKKNIDILGYYNGKIIPYYCLPQITHDFFCNKQLNWFEKPKSEYIKRFCKKNYDLLITYSQHENMPFKYILATANANFITGYSIDLHQYLDLSLTFTYIPTLLEVFNNLDMYTKNLSGNSFSQK